MANPVMMILAMDCSSTACSVAISRGDTVIASEFSPMSRGHAAALPPMISRVMTARGLSARDMDAFAVSIGPGSFTGLRVAMAAAKGLAVASNRPLVGISCFDAVARRAENERGESAFDALLLALASKREELFVQARDHTGREIIPGQVLSPTEIDRLIGADLNEGARLHVAGDASKLVAEVLRVPEAHCRAHVVEGPAMPPDATDIALLANDVSKRGPNTSNAYTPGLVPIYLRPPDAKTSP